MITMIANADQNSPHATRNSPPHGAILVLPHGSAAVAGRNAIIAPSTTPIAATVKPWSSFTNTSGTAHAIAVTGRRRATAETENASSGTASAISWKSKLIICCRPQENAYANPISRPVLRPVNTNAAVTTGKTDTAASSAWKNSSVPAEGKTRKNGASTPRATWKWLPSRLNPGPSTSTTGACSWDNCLTYSV